MTTFPILAIASASGGCAAAMVADGQILAQARLKEERGLAGAMPEMVHGLLAKAGTPALVAVVVGPGSFTGLRAGISLAQGVAIGAGVDIVGVTVTEALAEALPHLGGRHLWVATDSRRNRLFLDTGQGPAAVELDDLPQTGERIAVAGDAANLAAAVLAARNVDVMLTSARRPAPRLVANVAARRAAGLLPPLAAVPLYVDAPAAKQPAQGLRPPPAEL